MSSAWTTWALQVKDTGLSVNVVNTTKTKDEDSEAEPYHWAARELRGNKSKKKMSVDPDMVLEQNRLCLVCKELDNLC